MKKYILILMLLLIPMINAMDIDNSLEYENNDRVAVITNAFGFGDTIARAELITPLENYVMPGKDRRVMIYDIEVYEDYNNALKKLDIIDMKSGKNKQKEFHYEIAVYNDVEVNDYEKICDEVTGCYSELVGSHIENQITGWSELNTKDLFKGNFTIALVTDVKMKDYYDGIFTMFGEKLSKHAVWTSGLNTGLIAGYNMTFPVVSQLLDVVTGENNMSRVGTPDLLDQGIIAKGSHYDGAGEYHQNDSSQTDIPTGDETRSFSFWFNSTDSTQDDQGIMGFGSVATVRQTTSVQLSLGGSLALISLGGDDETIASGVSYDEWHHVVVTYEEGSNLAIIYFDGANTANHSYGGSLNVDSMVSIGTQPWDVAREFDGIVDEVYIFNRSLSFDEAIQLYNGGLAISFESSVVPVITLNNPVSFLNSSLTEIRFNCSSSGIEILNISLIIDGQINTTLTNSSTANFLDLEVNRTFDDGNYNWTCTSSNSQGEGTTDERNFTIDTSKPLLNITNPNGTVSYGRVGINETLNWTITETTPDTCIFEYNATNTTVNCLDLNRSFTLDTSKNITLWANDSFGNTVAVKSTWDYKVFENSRNFTTVVTEGSSEDFMLNITLGSSETISSAFLNYNLTNLAAEITTIGSEIILDNPLNIPNVNADTNVTFFWVINLASEQINSTTSNQTVLNFGIDDCSSFGTLILNYTLVDEEFQNFLVGNLDNTTIELDINISTLGGTTPVIQFSQLYNQTNPALVCVKNDTLQTTSYRLDALARYESTGRVSEFHNIQNFTLQNSSTSNLPQNITLFDLATADSTEFRIQFKDANFLPVENALINIQRNYISEGVFKSVEIGKTDRDGFASVHLVQTEVIYTILVSKEGVILGTFDNRIAVCDNELTGECNILLNELQESVATEDFESINGLTFSADINQSTRNIEIIFTTSDSSSAEIKLNTTKFDNFGNTQVCFDSLVSSSGTLTCSIDDTIGNVTVISVLTKNDKPVRTFTFTLVEDPQSIYGGSGLVMALVFVMAIPFLFITEPRGIIIGAMLGVIVVAMLGLYVSGAFLAIGSSTLWLVVMAIIAIYKISEREK